MKPQDLLKEKKQVMLLNRFYTFIRTKNQVQTFKLLLEKPIQVWLEEYKKTGDVLVFLKPNHGYNNALECCLDVIESDISLGYKGILGKHNRADMFLSTARKYYININAINRSLKKI